MASPSQQRVDYDTIAHLYDEPGRDHDTDSNLISFLNERTDIRPTQAHILDLGCGTGKQLSANRQKYPDLTMIGLDLFRGMLHQARKRNKSVLWVQGNGIAPPFHSDSFDYITNQFSYSHVLDKESFIHETFRILKPRGRFVITHIDPWSMVNWIVYTYFPAARARDFQDFLPIEDLVNRMEATGFSNIQVNRQYRQEQLDLGQFLEYASQRYRTSQLVAIPDTDYEAGVARLTSLVESSHKHRLVDSELCLVTVSGDKRL